MGPDHVDLRYLGSCDQGRGRVSSGCRGSPLEVCGGGDEDGRARRRLRKRVWAGEGKTWVGVGHRNEEKRKHSQGAEGTEPGEWWALGARCTCSRGHEGCSLSYRDGRGN